MLEGIGLIFGKLLLIVVLARPGDTVEEDASMGGVAQVVDEGDNDKADASGGEDGEDANHDALGGGA